MPWKDNVHAARECLRFVGDSDTRFQLGVEKVMLRKDKILAIKKRLFEVEIFDCLFGA